MEVKGLEESQRKQEDRKGRAEVLVIVSGSTRKELSRVRQRWESRGETSGGKWGGRTAMVRDRVAPSREIDLQRYPTLTSTLTLYVLWHSAARRTHSPLWFPATIRVMGHCHCCSPSIVQPDTLVKPLFTSVEPSSIIVIKKLWQLCKIFSKQLFYYLNVSIHIVKL